MMWTRVWVLFLALAATSWGLESAAEVDPCHFVSIEDGIEYCSTRFVRGEGTSSDSVVPIHVSRVDLTQAQLRLTSTHPDDRLRQVSSFARIYGCAVAVNASFFDNRVESPTYGTPWSRVVGEGETWGLGTEHPAACVASDPEGHVYFRAGTPLEGWEWAAVPGRHLLVEHGQAIGDCQGFDQPCNCCRPSQVEGSEQCEPTCQNGYAIHPRTAVGMTADSRMLYLVVADGQGDHDSGLSIPELAALMRELGSDWALNLDGGGSSAMYVRDQAPEREGIVNEPTDESSVERLVANHLGFCAGRRPWSVMQPEPLVWAYPSDRGLTFRIPESQLDVHSACPGTFVVLREGRSEDGYESLVDTVLESLEHGWSIEVVADWATSECWTPVERVIAHADGGDIGAP